MNGAFAALAVAVLLGGAPLQSRTLAAGPALAGDRVVWGEQRGQTSVVVGAGSSAPLWQSRSAWLAGPLAGSRSTVAFAASSNGCSGVNTACPVETTFFARRPGQGWIPITPPVRCVSTAAGRTLAISGPFVATVTPNCDSGAKATLLVRRDGRVVLRRTGVECCDVALAGTTLAWRGGGAVDVFDLATRRLRFRAAPPAGAPIAAFDVQADGKLAMLVGRQPDGHATIAWRLAAVIPGNQPGLRLIGDRLVLEIAPHTAPTDNVPRSALVVSDLAGRTRVLARFSGRLEQVGGFDATTRTVTWASRRIIRTRLDCPSPRQGCMVRKTGTLTIWRAEIVGGPIQAVASWAFTDAP
jgi:hypothetical protein